MTFTQFAGLLSNLVVAVVVPVLAWLAKRLFDQQVDLLKARADLLRETQYDRAVSLLEAQKKVFAMEREHLDQRIATLEASGEAASEELTKTRVEFERVKGFLQRLEADAKNSSRDLLVQVIFSADVIFQAHEIGHRIDLESTIMLSRQPEVG